MKIYSETTISFALKCEQMLKEIITNELALKMRRSRFELGGFIYPLQVVVIESERNLGSFDPHTYQIAVNKALMYQAKDDVLKNILRHEMAHYLTYIRTSDLSCPHGAEFKHTCELYGWSDCVSKASMNIDLANSAEGNLASEKMITKIKALLSLAQSDNVHEAELATYKANQLLLKHNIKAIESPNNGEEVPFYVSTVIQTKRRNAKIQAIYDILQHFMVKPILIMGKGVVSLEVTGTKENIELAEYVAKFLDSELERLWKLSQLKGMKAKNSFFMGIAKGHHEKMKNLEKGLSSKDQSALTIAKQNLDEKLNKVYRRLSHTKSSSQRDQKAYGAGQKAGKSLTINSALNSKGSKWIKKLELH